MTHTWGLAPRFDSRLSSRRASSSRHAAIATSLLLVIGAWCFFRPYEGITGDAILYVGRGVADLAPNSVGRDIMFVEDGQFGFSLFNPILGQLARLLGIGWTSLLLVSAAQALWLAAITGLVRILTEKRAWLLPTALLCVAALPSFYGPFQRLHFAETIAVPRPWAEAFVLFALTAAACRRDLLAGALLIVAAGLHPIMALAGIATLLLVKGMEDRRWMIGVGLLAAITIGAGLVGFPLAGRLFIKMDAEWRSITASRNPLLFPSLWPLSDYGAFAVQAASVAVAAFTAQGRLRMILLAALATALVGLASAELFGDQLSSLLVIQAQPWRMLWLVAVLGAATLAPTTVELWRRGSTYRLVPFVLLLGWAFLHEPYVAFACSLSALVLLGMAGRPAFQAGDATIRRVIVAICILIAVDLAFELAGLRAAVSRAPDPYRQAVDLLRKLNLVSVPVALCAIAFALASVTKPRPFPRIAGLAVSVAIVVSAAWVWDGRAAMQKEVEDHGPPADLGRLVAARPGPVIWLDGIDETTFWMRRANWYSTLQGTSIVFSRPLAIEWARRRSQAARFGFIPKGEGDLPVDVSTRPLPSLEAGQLAGACTDLQDLAWIVLPIPQAASDPSGVPHLDWTPPAPVYRFVILEAIEWQRIDHYALIDCRTIHAQPKG